MNRANAWYVGGGVLFVIWAAFMGLMPQRTNPAFDFIAGNRPVTEDQVPEIGFRWVDGCSDSSAGTLLCRHGIERW